MKNILVFAGIVLGIVFLSLILNWLGTMQLKWFLFIAILSVLGIGFSPKRHLMYYPIFLILGGFAVFTIHNYLYPSNRAVFENTDYHVFEQLGIAFHDSIDLVNSNFPEIALWDDKDGQVEAFAKPDGVAIQMKKFEAPFYIQDNRRKKRYHLINNYVPLNASKGFKIQLQDSSGARHNWLKVKVQIIPERKSRCQYVVTYQQVIDTVIQQQLDTSSFNKVLSIGYNLADIITKAQKINLTEQDYELLTGSYLMRSTYIHDKEIQNTSDLVLFPGAPLIDTGFYFVASGQEVNSKEIAFDKTAFISNQQKFFIGLGGTNATAFWRVHSSGKKAKLLHVVPKRFRLKNDTDSARLFITSSSAEILENDYDAGYLLSEFETKNHFFHFNGNIRYRKSNARTKMHFYVIDRNSPNEQTDQRDNQVIYGANDTIRLFTPAYKWYAITKKDGTVTRGILTTENEREVTKVRNYIQLKTEDGQLIRVNASDIEDIGADQQAISTQSRIHTWLFKMNDLRANNPLKTQHLYHFILAVVLLIWLTLLINRENVTRIEISAYVVLLSFLLVRVILLWRVSTFIPLEEITDKILTKMLSRNYFNLTIAYTLFLFGMRWVITLWRRMVRKLDTANSAKETDKVYQQMHEQTVQMGVVFTVVYLLIFLVTRLLKDFDLKILGLTVLPTIVVWAIHFFLIDKRYEAARNDYKKFKVLQWQSLGLLLLFAGFLGFGALAGTFDIITYPSLGIPLLAMLFTINYFKYQYPAIIGNLEGKTQNWLAGAVRNESLPFWQLAFIIIGAYLGLITLWVLKDFIGALATYERFINIAFPILLYFSFSAILRYIVDQRRYKSNLSTLQATEWDRVLWVGRLNWLFCAGFLGIADSGFGIIFLLFTPFLLAYKNFVEFGHHHGQPIANTYLRNGIIMLFVGGGFLFGCNTLVESIFQYTTIWIVGAIVSFGFLIPFWIHVLNKDNFDKSGYFFWIAVPKINYLTPRLSIELTSLLIGVCIVLGWNKINDVVAGKQYIYYRAAIHHIDLENLASDAGFRSEKMQKLLEASQNQWFISQYLETPPAYFALKEHFNKGVSYITQTTDLVTLRYIIAEHGQLLVGFLVLLLFCFFIVIARNTISKVFVNYTVLGIALLLTCVGFFVWITASNRFIFFGQDFPIVSIQSHMTLFFTISLLLGILMLVKEKGSAALVPKPILQNTNDVRIGAKLLAPMGILLIATGVLLFKKSNKSQADFNLNTTIRAAQNDFNQLNKDFRYYQREHLDSIGVFSRNVPTLLERFSKWAVGRSDAFGKITSHTNPFTQSVYEDFKTHTHSEMLDPNQILHLKRPEARYYEFAMNNQYYLLRSPQEDEQQWSGSLLAANTSNDFQLLNRNRQDQLPYTLENDKVYADIFERPGVYNKTLEDLIKVGIQNIQILSLPNHWSKDGMPLVIISRTTGDQPQNRGHYAISNTDEYIRSDSTAKFFAHRLLPNDDINLFDRNNRKEQFKLIANHKRYLAKNIWLNNKQKLLYPMGHKMIWAYNYANLLNNRLQGEALDVVVALDYDLNEYLYDLANELTYHNRHNRRKSDLSAVVMDGKGRLRVLLDYKKNKNYRFNPNDTEEFSKLFKAFYLQSNLVSERNTFGNRCFQRLEHGPGSTAKPIMYANVTSGFKPNQGWRNLVLLEPSAEEYNLSLNSGGGRHFVKRYGGRDIPKWKILTTRSFDNVTYIIKSSNVYHSLMMFMGSYTKEELIGLNNPAQANIFKRANEMEAKNRFPKFQFGGTYVFNPYSWPEFTKENSVLANQLPENFNLTISSRTTQSDLSADIKALSPLDEATTKKILTSTSSYKLWSMPEPSHFYQRDRGGDDYRSSGIRQSTIGASPIEVTPVKMVEMAGRMASVNQNFHTTFKINGNEQPYKRFKTDPSWGSSNNLIQFYKNSVYKGMAGAVQLGTARGIVGPLTRDKDKDISKYYFYAKTGTIGPRGSRDDKNLMIIISQNDLTTIAADEIENNRFYVIYTSFFRNDNYNYEQKRFIQALIKSVMKSSLFKDYMEEGK